MKTFLILILIASVGYSIELDPNFVKAIHQVETGGRLGAIKGDNGRALGPLQIHYSYWKDSRTKGSYIQVTNYNYAVRVMENYLTRYAPTAVKNKDFETLARTHNGGPRGPRNKNTIKYWTRVKNML